jgi:hypothetical protein
LNAFPPEDIRDFLQLSAGEWLALRSLLDPDGPEEVEEPLEKRLEPDAVSQRWHQAERGELKVSVLEPHGPQDWGGLEVCPPDGTSVRLSFRRDGTVELGNQWGRWQLAADGSLELEMALEGRVVKELALHLGTIPGWSPGEGKLQLGDQAGAPPRGCRAAHARLNDAD